MKKRARKIQLCYKLTGNGLLWALTDAYGHKDHENILFYDCTASYE